MIHELVLNDEELRAIETLEPMLAELQDYFGTANTIQSVESGEVIKGEEIARTRGILDFLYAYRAVRVI
jgi:hypothetical protein